MPNSNSSPSLRRHVLVRNAVLSSIRQDRDQRLNLLKQAYYLPDEEEDKAWMPSSNTGPNVEMKQEDSEMSENSNVLREAREEVKREMKRELKVRNPTVIMVESGSSSESDGDDSGDESDESMEDIEEYYRLRNQRFNETVQVSKILPEAPRRSMASLSGSASVKPLSSTSIQPASSIPLPRPSASPVKTSRPGLTPVQSRPSMPTRPSASPVQSVRPTLTRPSLSLLQEIAQSSTFSAQVEVSSQERPTVTSRPSLQQRPGRPGLQRNVQVNEIQSIIKEEAAQAEKSVALVSELVKKDQEDVENDKLAAPYSQLDSTSTFNAQGSSTSIGMSMGRRNSEERKEEEWFDDLLNELGNNGMKQMKQGDGSNQEMNSLSDSDYSSFDEDEDEDDNREEIESDSTTPPTSDQGTSKSNPVSKSSNEFTDSEMDTEMSLSDQISSWRNHHCSPQNDESLKEVKMEVDAIPYASLI